MSRRAHFGKLHSLIAAIGVMFITLLPARAAELIMFEERGCVWCAAFDREVASVYDKTTEGQRAPLRRHTLGVPLPPDLTFVQTERLTPLFVLVDKGREIGRIRGYPGEDHFWGLLGVLIKKLDTDSSENEPAHDGSLKPLRAAARSSVVRRL